MKISSKDFRVREGDEVNLKKWPTTVKPVYKSKEQYQKLLEEHVAQLSSLQELHYASNRHAVLLIFQAMDAGGCVDIGDLVVRAIISRSSIKPLLTTFHGSHCCNIVNSALLPGRIVQECAMSRPGEIAGDQLRTIVERIERIEEDIKELVEGKKEIYFEAKGNGFDVKIIREVIRVRKQDQKQREEQDSLLDLYLQAIKGAARAAKAA